MTTELNSETLDFQFLLLNILNMIENAKGEVFPAEESWMVDGGKLALKYATNLLSIADLLEGTKPSVTNYDGNINFIDYHSIFAIARSALETYLTFHYLFGESEVEEDEKKYRYTLWTLSSLGNRQRFSVFSQVMRDVLDQDLVEIQRLLNVIISSPYFNGASTSCKARRSIQRRNTRVDWKPEGGWSALAERASINHRFFDDAYNLLSSVSHSDQVVVNFIDNSQGLDTQQRLVTVGLNITNVITAALMANYSSVYKGGESYLQNNSDLRQKIEILKHIHGDAYEQINF